MGKIKKDFRFKVVDNFLSEEEIILLKNYSIIKHRINDDMFENDTVINPVAEFYLYGDPTFDSLLLSKLKLMEKETQTNLLPCNSYWRMYTYGSVLPMHTDRPSCEISVTVCIGGDKDWPFIVEGVPYVLKPGSAIIYLGTELQHSRKPYDGDWHSQVFLHYVDAYGKYKDEYKDRRQFFGTGKREGGFF